MPGIKNLLDDWDRIKGVVCPKKTLAPTDPEPLPKIPTTPKKKGRKVTLVSPPLHWYHHLCYWYHGVSLLMLLAPCRLLLLVSWISLLNSVVITGVIVIEHCYTL